jgi:hypothetical protein
MVKIFGERNTATNALARVITDNSSSRLLPSTEYDLDPDASRHAWAQHDPRERERLLDEIYAGVADPHSWKHCSTNPMDPAAFDQTLVLFCLRHPASWFVSLFRNPYHALAELPEKIAHFVEFRWETPERENLSGASFRPLELYNAKLHSYLEFAKRLESQGMECAFIRQEDLLLNSKQVFSSLAPKLLHSRKRFRRRLRSAKNGWMPLFIVERYYARERWKESLRGCEAAINRQVDWGALKSFGYEPL